MNANTATRQRIYNLDGGGGCRVVIYATRLAIHPPTTANGINPSCPISPERFHLPLPSPTFSFSFSLCLSCTPPPPTALFLPRFLSSFPLFSLISPLVSCSSIQPCPTGLSPLYFPLPPLFVSIVPRSWWC